MMWVVLPGIQYNYLLESVMRVWLLHKSTGKVGLIIGSSEQECSDYYAFH